MTFLNRGLLRLLLSLTLLAIACPAFAQTDRATLEGTITDSSGAGHSLHCGLNAPPVASQAYVLGVASEDKPCSNDGTVGE
jgi:hypothetical protein